MLKQSPSFALDLFSASWVFRSRLIADPSSSFPLRVRTIAHNVFRGALAACEPIGLDHNAVGQGPREDGPCCLMGCHFLRPKFMSNLRKGLAIEIGDIVEAAIDCCHFVFGQVQGDPLFPKLIEGKIIT